ncbi:hypothetical protein P691DRAFT_704875 [Macrolepiota fuliginosa MF-IS2]|uniref:F-box domain-containing protein n=1 Tax=Macrolepiota fuliginosa MF-IS2 TaxID=1400762 RepID=A0A9P5XFD4_9AGAR|nr:hypothetical protein P691DRAFT_704875 [Macrolepiota fuliginosa MF-IS2]
MPLPVSVVVKQHIRSMLSPHSKRSSQALNPPIPSPLAPVYPTLSLPLRSGSQWDSSFSQLPLEVWVEIFSHCPTDFPRIDSQVPPLTLALVCRTWYHLIAATPRLWSCFEVVLQGVGSSQLVYDGIKRKLQTWLRRSRQHPISFRIVHDYTGNAPDLRSAELLTLLLPHASRWQNVQFHGPSGGLAYLPVTLFEGGLPALESISIHLHRSWSSTFDIGSLKIPWSQLTGLDLQFYQNRIHSLDECFEILSAARNLTWCTLNANCVFTLPRTTEKPALPSLKSLKLIIQANDSAASPEESLLNFLECLSVVDLRAFSLEWLVSRTHDGLEPCWSAFHSRFTDFIQSSASSLEDLGLAYVPLRDHEIISCLDRLSSLRTLDLKFTLADHHPDPITEDLLLYLSPPVPLPAMQRVRQRISTADHFPVLGNLKLQCCGEHLNQAMLLALIEGRAAARLRAFELMTAKLLSKDFRERILHWQKHGYRFSLSTLNIR